jgi:hypothetical protein
VAGKAALTHPVHTLVRARPFDFDAATVRSEFEPMLADAEREGLLPIVSFPRLSGHPYSGGYDSRPIADRIAQVFPEARILIVIREQRSTIVSTYKQYVHAGGEGRSSSTSSSRQSSANGAFQASTTATSPTTA